MVTIGFAYDAPPAEDSLDAADSVAAEYEDERTIRWLADALRRFGRVVEIPWGSEAPQRILRGDLDVVFNITEAAGSRNREGLVPALAEAAGIPVTGSDALALGTSLDKYMTKVLAAHAGIPTPAFVLVGSVQDLQAQRQAIERIGFPVIAKPNTGGSSMGIRMSSKVSNWAELELAVSWVLDTFDDAVLIERFVRGVEYTSGLLERDGLMALPIAEIRLEGGNPDAFYSIEQKSVHRKEVLCPAELPERLRSLMDDYSRRLFVTLGCRGVARVDFRLAEADQVPYLLEINPMPGLSPYYSIFPMQAEQAGLSPEDIVGALIERALGNQIKQNGSDAIHARRHYVETTGFRTYSDDRPSIRVHRP